MKEPVEAPGITVLFEDAEGRQPAKESASFVRLAGHFYSVRFAWPAEAETARNVSKMLRDAYDLGRRSKAAEIRDVLGIGEEIGDRLSELDR